MQPRHVPLHRRKKHGRTTSPLPPDPMKRAIESTWLYTAILSNQRMLACVDDTGEIAQIFFPHIDAGPHLRALLTGIELGELQPAKPSDLEATSISEVNDEEREPVVLWLANSSWSHELRYDDNTAMLNITSRQIGVPVQVERKLFIAHDCDVLVNEITVTNLGDHPVACRVALYANIDPYQRNKYNTAYFDVATQLLSVFGSDVYFAIGASAPAIDFATGKVTHTKADRIFDDAKIGEWNHHEYNIGQASAAVRYDLGTVPANGSATMRLHLCGAASLAEVTDFTLRTLADPPAAHASRKWWQVRLAHQPLANLDATARTVYARSLLTLSMLMDRTGGIIAAPELDPDFRSCGGYGMCWPRDGAFVAHALDLATKHDQARAFYDWALRVQEPSGVWYQRYFMDGTLAPTWGLVQFDETGAIVWAICRHIAMLQDRDYAHACWPQLVRAGEYMQSALDAETGLPPFTKELWEERDTISTYASAATWGAFHQLSLLAESLGDTISQQHWQEAANALKSAIVEHLWDEERGYFARGRRLRLRKEAMEEMIKRGDATADDFETRTVMGKEQHFSRVDSTIDTSSLGLSVPFGVFAPDDSRIVATARAVAEHLTSPVGGIYRYSNDHYREGNPWVICTLWLAWQQALSGQIDAAHQLFQWVTDHRTSLDLLPEQVHKETGEPIWVIPLGWSHAMYIIMAHVLEQAGV